MVYDWDGTRTRRKSTWKLIAAALLGLAAALVTFGVYAEAQECQPRKTCSKIDSCDEAMWYLQNCSWGGKLDRDSDGRPCESLCGSAD